MRIPLVDVAAQHAELAPELEPLILDVIRSGHLVGGPHVAAFERAYADFVGTAHGLGVANGTDAIEIALRAVGVEAGDEVLVPGNTFIATAEAASRIGARPVPVDVDPVHLLIDPDAVAAAVTPRTSAIVPVHLYGQVAPMEQLTTIAAAHGLPIVEDAAQAQGARRNGRSAGAWGLAAATSLYPGKNLGAYGDAGAITTDDAEVDARMRLAANHGSREKYVHEVVGMNSRLDAVQAAMLTVKLRHLPAWNARRREIAERYDRLIEGGEHLQLPKTMAGNEDAWHLYVIRVDDREGVRAALGRADIEAGVHYPQPWYLSPAYEHLGYRAGTCPVAEDAAARILSLPIHPHLDQAQQERVVDALHQAVNS
ncbi:DegT/DnrJ/EryC1/StrS family aminotransferase [Microbacterium sp. RD1]|uniref:DegT/DnrJ/EryC1/StrS family aminotransferase n=1 Tax=Microbacterium sp. RD1 TaxID=3457313 RepID=UPI003FA5D8F9